MGTWRVDRRTFLGSLTLGLMACGDKTPVRADKAPVLAPGATLERIAFASSADQDAPQPFWPEIAAIQPDLFIFLGDAVYGDPMRDGEFVFDAAYLRSAYLKLSAIPEFDAFRKTVPIDAIWNDRDFGLSHSGADNPGKESARDIFLKFWNVPPEDPRHSRNGVYFSRLIGAPGRRVQLIFLDTRSFRSPLRPTDERGVKGKERWLPDDNPAKTLLGDAQWAWLEAQLRQPAELRIIASGIQVLAEGHGFERWGTLPRERARLLRLIDETGAGGVVFLSGDRQVAAHYRSEEARVPLYEATSSGLNRTMPSAQERGPHQLGDVYGGENFGLLTIDWVEGTVLLDVRRTDGTLVRQTGVTLAKLASGAGEPGPDPAPGGGQALPEIDNT